ncbi:uncharacterized protein [Clytia hemisphaerica]
MQRLFDTFDCDMNGRISRRELKAVFKALNVTINDENLRSMFHSADKDKSGFIEFGEFVRVFSPPSQDELLNAFKRFDKNGDGFLTPDEVKEVLRDANQPATDRNVTEMIESVDSNGDGKINYKEFLTMLKS